MMAMKYYDKNGSEWSVDKGDWIGSFERNVEVKSWKKFPVRLYIPLILIIILSALFLNLS